LRDRRTLPLKDNILTQIPTVGYLQRGLSVKETPLKKLGCLPIGLFHAIEPVHQNLVADQAGHGPLLLGPYSIREEEISQHIFDMSGMPST
jgi:hypothetical protein